MRLSGGRVAPRSLISLFEVLVPGGVEYLCSYDTHKDHGTCNEKEQPGDGRIPAGRSSFSFPCHFLPVIRSFTDINASCLCFSVVVRFVCDLNRAKPALRFSVGGYFRRKCADLKNIIQLKYTFTGYFVNPYFTGGPVD